MKGKPDYILVVSVGLLILLGLVILTSVLAGFSQENFGYPTFYLFRYILFGLLPGLIFGFLAYRIPLSLVKKRIAFLLLANLVFLVLVFVPKVGLSYGGASSWINLGITSFQPSEFLKLSFILYLAAWLTSRTSQKPKSLGRGGLRIERFPGTLVAFLTVLGLISFLLSKQPDVGTLGIIVVISALMYFLAGTPLKHSFLIFSSLLAAFLFLINQASYRWERLLTFLRPEIDPMGTSYHIHQALIAIGSGGIFGRGLGWSVQRFGFLPQSMSDSIFAIFSEESGFLGGFILFSLFLIFTWRGFTIAKNSQDKFCQLTASGITCWITLQAFVNIASIVGLFPLTGIPLPFISYGGSALVAELIGIGVLLNIAKHA